jgi:hypothetical protein
VHQQGFQGAFEPDNHHQNPKIWKKSVVNFPWSLCGNYIYQWIFHLVPTPTIRARCCISKIKQNVIQILLLYGTSIHTFVYIKTTLHPPMCNTLLMRFFKLSTHPNTASSSNRCCAASHFFLMLYAARNLYMFREQQKKNPFRACVNITSNRKKSFALYKTSSGKSAGFL